MLFRAMREAGAIAALVLDEVARFVAPGVTTLDVDAYAAARIRSHGARSAFLGYRDYPCHVCISVNEEVVHGIAGRRRLEFGDLASIDVGVFYHGFVGDTARTVPVGGCDARAQKLIVD